MLRYIGGIWYDISAAGIWNCSVGNYGGPSLANGVRTLGFYMPRSGTTILVTVYDWYRIHCN